MTQISFSDIGKRFKDLFTKQFPVGIMKCSAKFPETSGLSVNFNGSIQLDTGQFSPNLELKIPIKLGFTLIEKWTTKNELSSTLEFKPFNSLTNSVEVVFEPSNGQTSIKTKNSYKSDLITTSGDIKFKTLKPEICLSLMTNLIPSIPLDGGGTITYDVNKKKFSNLGYGLQITKSNICLSSLISNKEFIGQIFMRLSENVDIGVETGWNQELKTSKFGGVSQFNLNSGSFFKAKIESSGFLSFGYTFTLKEGIKTTFGVRLDGKNISSGNHQYGIEVEF